MIMVRMIWRRMMMKTLRNITGYLPSCAAPVTANLEEKQHILYIWDQYEVVGHIEGICR